jgi:hypothetical protein
MPELHDLLERRASGHQPPPDLFDRVVDRRRRRDRNRRVGTVVVAVAVAAAGIGGLLRAFYSDPDTRPAGRPSPFVGAWASTDLQTNESQAMTIRAAEDGVFDIELHDDYSWACFPEMPTTMTGTGRLEDPTTLVVPSPVLTCADGSEPIVDGDRSEEEGGPPPLEEGLISNYTLVFDVATDRLFDSLGAVWYRGATPENAANRAGGSFLFGEVTVRATGPWKREPLASFDESLFYLSGPDGAEMQLIANPLPPSCTLAPRVPPSAEALVRAIRSDPDLETTVPVAERVGGIDALRLDVAAVPGALTCPAAGDVPVVSLHDFQQAWVGIERGELARLYVLDLPGGSARTMAVKITAPEAAFERALEAAAPVVDSFQFHTD